MSALLNVKGLKSGYGVVEAYLGHGTAERLQKNVSQAQTAQEAQA